MVRDSLAKDREFSIAEYFEMEAPGLLPVTFSRPYGTFRPSNLYPGLRPGLRSAGPAGLILQSPGFFADRVNPEDDGDRSSVIAGREL